MVVNAPSLNSVAAVMSFSCEVGLAHLSFTLTVYSVVFIVPESGSRMKTFTAIVVPGMTQLTPPTKSCST